MEPGVRHLSPRQNESRSEVREAVHAVGVCIGRPEGASRDVFQVQGFYIERFFSFERLLTIRAVIEASSGNFSAQKFLYQRAL